MSDWTEKVLTEKAEDADDQTLAGLAAQAGVALAASGRVCGTAESCTGGLVAKLLTDIAGSSGWFDCGYVTYSNQAKQNMLGVPLSLTVAAGAVSREVVLAMSAGVIERGGVEIAVAISGVAGPDGGSVEKPVGTVWIAWARADNTRQAIRYQFDGDRDRIRRLAAGQALRGIILCANSV